eukprot:365693-Chlamydomonas_euryale.AAC.11
MAVGVWRALRGRGVWGAALSGVRSATGKGGETIEDIGQISRLTDGWVVAWTKSEGSIALKNSHFHVSKRSILQQAGK